MQGVTTCADGCASSVTVNASTGNVIAGNSFTSSNGVIFTGSSANVLQANNIDVPLTAISYDASSNNNIGTQLNVLTNSTTVSDSGSGNAPFIVSNPTVTQTIAEPTGTRTVITNATTTSSVIGTPVLDLLAPNIFASGGGTALRVGVAASDFNNGAFFFSNFGPANIANSIYMSVGANTAPNGICVSKAGIIGVGYSFSNANCPSTGDVMQVAGTADMTRLKLASGTTMTANQGNGASVQHSTGTTTTNDCVKFDANGNTIDAGAACGSGGGSVSITAASAALTVSPSPITGTGTVDLNLAHANTWTANQTRLLLSTATFGFTMFSTYVLHVSSSSPVFQSATWQRETLGLLLGRLMGRHGSYWNSAKHDVTLDTNGSLFLGSMSLVLALMHGATSSTFIVNGPLASGTASVNIPFPITVNSCSGCFNAGTVLPLSKSNNYSAYGDSITVGQQALPARQLSVSLHWLNTGCTLHRSVTTRVGSSC